MKNAVEGMRAICDYAKGSKVKIVIEPHGGYSNDPDWLLAVIKNSITRMPACCRTSTTSGVTTVTTASSGRSPTRRPSAPRH